jgi:hypothetical protein
MQHMYKSCFHSSTQLKHQQQLFAPSTNLQDNKYHSTACKFYTPSLSKIPRTTFAMGPRDPRHPQCNPYWNPYSVSAPSTPCYEPRQGYFSAGHRRVSRVSTPSGDYMPDGTWYRGMGPCLDPYWWTTFEDGRFR